MIKRLHRSRNNKMIAGVSAGIAEYFHIDPVVVRLGMVFLFIATGLIPILVLYLAAIVMVPQSDDHDAAQI